MEVREPPPYGVGQVCAIIDDQCPVHPIRGRVNVDKGEEEKVSRSVNSKGSKAEGLARIDCYRGVKACRKLGEECKM